MDLAINSLVQSPLYRNLSTIPADLHPFTFHINQMTPPFSVTKLEQSPKTTGLGDDDTYEWELTKYGYLKDIVLKLEFRQYPTFRTSIMPVFPLYHKITQAILRTHHRPIETLYGSSIMTKHVYFSQEMETMQHLKQGFYPPMEITNYNDWMKLYDRYLTYTSGTSDSVVSIDNDRGRQNNYDKFIKSFEPFNPSQWDNANASNVSGTYYGITTLYCSLPFATTENLHMNWDTRFVEPLTLTVQLQSADSGEPLYQAWGVLLLSPNKTPVTTLATINDMIVALPTVEGATTTTIETGTEGGADLLASWQAVGVEGALQTTRTTLNNKNDYYNPAIYGPYTDTAAVGIGANGGAPNIPNYIFVGGHDLSQAVLADYYVYVAGGIRTKASAVDYTTSSEMNSARFYDWVLAHYYLSFPWLTIQNSTDKTDWDGLTHLGSGSSWANMSWSQDLKVEGGNSLSNSMGTPPKAYFKPTLLCFYWNPHDSVREIISATNYKDDEPATILIYDTYREHSNKAYGTSTASVNVGDLMEVTLQSKNLCYAIAVVAKESNAVTALSWADVHSDRGGAGVNSYNQAADDFGGAGGNVAPANATIGMESYAATNPVGWGGSGNSTGDEFYDLNYYSTSEMPYANIQISAMSQPGNDTNLYEALLSRTFHHTHIPPFAMRTIQNTKTILPTYWEFQAAGRTLQSSSQLDSADFTDLSTISLHRGQPDAELFMQPMKICYNELDRRGTPVSPDKLPDLIQQLPLSNITKRSYGKMQDHLKATLIQASLNLTDQLTIGGGFSLQSLPSPKLRFKFDRPCRLDIYVLHWSLLQIDSNTGAVNKSIDI